jgi:hypothetical protein
LPQRKVVLLLGTQLRLSDTLHAATIAHWALRSHRIVLSCRLHALVEGKSGVLRAEHQPAGVRNRRCCRRLGSWDWGKSARTRHLAEAPVPIGVRRDGGALVRVRLQEFMCGPLSVP